MAANIQILLRQILRLDFCSIVAGKQSGVIIGNVTDIPIHMLIVPEGIKCIFEPV